jgi:hypothetical protein
VPCNRKWHAHQQTLLSRKHTARFGGLYHIRPHGPLPQGFRKGYAEPLCNPQPTSVHHPVQVPLHASRYTTASGCSCCHRRAAPVPLNDLPGGGACPVVVLALPGAAVPGSPSLKHSRNHLCKNQEGCVVACRADQVLRGMQ